MLTAGLFLAFVAAMAVFMVALTAWYMGAGTATRLLAGLIGWFAYVSLLGYFGVVRNVTMRPPGPVFLFAPVAIFLVLFILRSPSARLARALPLWIVLATQAFRVGVELFIHQLWLIGLVPKMLTFSGANFDIYVGLTAPLIAWLSTRGRSGVRLALAWNVLGLLVLANIVARAVLTSPGPLNFIHAEVPDRMIGTFPYMLIPGFFVPLAVVLHVVAIRAITHRPLAATFQ